MAAAIGIVGLGAIGGAVAARLLATRAEGDSIGLAAGSEERAQALRTAGIVLRSSRTSLRKGTGAGPGELRVTAEDAAATLPALAGGARYRWLLLCTRAEATGRALDEALPLLAEDGAVVCLQNGLPEERVARAAGAARTLGAMIAWSATSEATGRITVTGRGGFVLGAYDPAGAHHLEAARTLLTRASPTRLTGNLAGARWGKLALNCAISALGAVSGLSFGELAGERDGRALALACIAEVAAIAQARGVRMARVSGLDPRWLADARGESLWRHGLFWLVSRQRPRQRSGMLERLLQGRTSGQIDDLNGAVVEAARALGRRAPINESLLERVHAIERGEASIGRENLAELAKIL